MPQQVFTIKLERKDEAGGRYTDMYQSSRVRVDYERRAVMWHSEDGEYYQVAVSHDPYAGVDTDAESAITLPPASVVYIENMSGSTTEILRPATRKR